MKFEFVGPLCKSILIGVPIGLTFVDCVGYVAKVEGTSMQPCLNPDRTQKDYVYLNRLAAKNLSNLSRGEVVSLNSPRDRNQIIIKRIVGLEGDVVSTLGYKKALVTVPKGHCWIEGDHTGNSMDSNFFGPVSCSLITAKAMFIVWPPNRWQRVSSTLPENRLPVEATAVTSVVY